MEMTLEKFETEWITMPHVNRHPGFMFMDLRKYAEWIEERLLLSKRGKDISEEFTIKYNSLNWVLKKLLDENGGYVLFFKSLPHIQQVEYIVDEFEFKSEKDCQDLRYVTNFILRLTKPKDVEIWRHRSRVGRERKEGIYSSITVLYKLWMCLSAEVQNTYDMLDSIKLCPDEEPASLMAIESEIVCHECETGNQAEAGNKNILQKQPADDRNEVSINSHFNMGKDEEDLKLILSGFKTVEWKYKKGDRTGLFAGDVSEDDWIAIINKPSKSHPAPKHKIPWVAKYACKSFVVQYLNGDFETAEQVFCLADGKEIKDLVYSNITKQNTKDICDERTGKIAQIIRSTM